MGEGRLRASEHASGVWIGVAPYTPLVQPEPPSRLVTYPKTCDKHEHTIVAWDPAARTGCPLCAALMRHAICETLLISERNFTRELWAAVKLVRAERRTAAHAD